MENFLEEYKGKRILITGGAGLIGSNLTRTLLKADADRIYLLDDLSSSEKWNIPKSSNVVFIHGSILDEKALEEAFSEQPSYVIHLAAHFANQKSIDNPDKDLLVNGLGTLKVLQYSRASNTDKFVFASSGCSVYGNAAPLPVKEDFISLHLDSPYQINKLLGELYCNFFHSHYGLQVVIGRFFNVYGPGEIPGKYRNVTPNFIYWALHDQPLSITGTGEETRDFTFVDDIVEGVLRAGTTPEAVGEAINLASGTETKVMDLAKMINNLVGNENGVKFVGRREWDKITRRRASIEKAIRILGYEPKIDIRKGIKRTVEWFLENKDKIERAARF